VPPTETRIGGSNITTHKGRPYNVRKRFRELTRSDEIA